MTSFQLFVFDFDGTLVDTKHDIACAVNLTLKELRLRPLDETTIFGYVGKGVVNLMTQSLRGTGYTDVDKGVELFMKHYEDHLMDSTDFFPQGRETLEHFAGKKQAVLSNKPERFIKKILEHLDALQLFDAIGGGDTYANKKPNPQGLLDMMDKFRVPKEAVVVIGDSLVDIETGRRAGVRTCGVTYGHAGRTSLEAAQPDWIIDDLSELKQHCR